MTRQNKMQYSTHNDEICAYIIKTMLNADVWALLYDKTCW